MRIFLTGGTGFIGSYVANELVNQGHQVTILARNPQKVSGFIGHPKIELVKGTLYDRVVIRQALAGKDACIHVALGWGDTAADMLAADTLPSLYIFETAAKLGVKRMIYTSSIAAFGENRERFSADTMTRPNNFYGATKAATENYFNAISHVYDVQCNIIRPGYTFGNPVVEGASIYTDLKLRNFVKNAKRNEPIRLVANDGTNFIWAGDLAKLYSAVLASDHNRQYYTGVSSEFHTWAEVAQMAIDYLGSRSEIILEDKGKKRQAEQLDVSLIEQAFGFKFYAAERLKEHLAYLADVEED